MSAIPTVVGLYSFDDCLGGWRQAINTGHIAFPRTVVVDHEVPIGILAPYVLELDREARVAPSGTGNLSNDNVIKRGSKVVDEIAQHGRNHRIRLLGHSKHVNPDVTLALGCADANSFVRIAMRVSPHLMLDFYHVALCPLDLEPPGLFHEVYL